MTPDALVSLELKNEQPKEKALQGFRLVSDSGEVFILSHTSDGINDVSILSVAAIPGMQNERVSTLSQTSRTCNSNPRVTGQRLWCLPHAEWAVLDPGLKITLGTGRQRGRSSKLHCSVPEHKSR